VNSPILAQVSQCLAYSSYKGNFPGYALHSLCRHAPPLPVRLHSRSAVRSTLLTVGSIPVTGHLPAGAQVAGLLARGVGLAPGGLGVLIAVRGAVGVVPPDAVMVKAVARQEVVQRVRLRSCFPDHARAVVRSWSVGRCRSGGGEGDGSHDELWCVRED